MVKIFVRDEKLYLERARKETQLESVTIYHERSKGQYKLIIFPASSSSSIRRGQILIQKSYPLVKIKLEKVRFSDRPFYNARFKNSYINYYIEN